MGPSSFFGFCPRFFLAFGLRFFFWLSASSSSGSLRPDIFAASWYGVGPELLKRGGVDLATEEGKDVLKDIGMGVQTMAQYKRKRR